jgi:uncharacterized membrane protein YfcA
MTPIEVAGILAAGIGAGTINTIVGSGSLVSFPMLLAFGYPPLVANVSNTVGLVPGALSGAVGYRRELRGQRPRAIRLGVAAAVGGMSGSALLLVLPATIFEEVVPFLVLAASGLVALQPRHALLIASRAPTGRTSLGLLLLGVYAAGFYGGYFGAAHSVLLIGVLGIFLADDIQRLNGLKNLLTAIVTATAGILFLLVAPLSWEAAFLIAVGSTIGGQVGAFVGRRIPHAALRLVIISVGMIVGIALLASKANAI